MSLSYWVVLIGLQQCSGSVGQVVHSIQSVKFNCAVKDAEFIVWSRNFLLSRISSAYNASHGEL